MKKASRAQNKQKERERTGPLTVANAVKINRSGVNDTYRGAKTRKRR
jgi:hypothetical protein